MVKILMDLQFGEVRARAVVAKDLAGSGYRHGIHRETPGRIERG